MKSFVLFPALILAHLIAQCMGQMKVCRKNLTGEFTGIVVKEERSCLLDSVIAKIIMVGINANLTVKGISNIKEIRPLDGSMLYLKNRTTVNKIRVTKLAGTSIKVEKTSLVKKLVLLKAGNVLAEGNFGSIESNLSKVLNVISSSVKDGIVVRQGTGAVNICGSNIGNRTAIVSRFGNVTLGNFSRGCSGSKFERSIRVARGEGFVTLQGSDSRNVLIQQQIGAVSLSSSSIGRILVEDIAGDVGLMTSTAKKGARLVNIEGGVLVMATGFFGELQVREQKRRAVGDTTIKESSFQKSKGSIRLTVLRRRRLTISNTNFFNGTASLSRNGPVVFNGNGDVNVTFDGDRRLRVFENNMGNVEFTECIGGLEIERNVIRNAKIERCTGDISIMQSVFRNLNCVGNDPEPTGKDNAIAKSASGQCAKFRP